jgi:hypothetical protein
VSAGASTQPHPPARCPAPEPPHARAVPFGRLPKVERKAIQKAAHRDVLRGGGDFEEPPICEYEMKEMLQCFDAHEGDPLECEKEIDVMNQCVSLYDRDPVRGAGSCCVAARVPQRVACLGPVAASTAVRLQAPRGGVISARTALAASCHRTSFTAPCRAFFAPHPLPWLARYRSRAQDPRQLVTKWQKNIRQRVFNHFVAARIQPRNLK